MIFHSATWRTSAADCIINRPNNRLILGRVSIHLPFCASVFVRIFPLAICHSIKLTGNDKIYKKFSDRCPASRAAQVNQVSEPLLLWLDEERIWSEYPSDFGGLRKSLYDAYARADCKRVYSTVTSHSNRCTADRLTICHTSCTTIFCCWFFFHIFVLFQCLCLIQHGRMQYKEQWQSCQCAFEANYDFLLLWLSIIHLYYNDKSFIGDNNLQQAITFWCALYLLHIGVCCQLLSYTFRAYTNQFSIKREYFCWFFVVVDVAFHSILLFFFAYRSPVLCTPFTTFALLVLWCRPVYAVCSSIAL